MRYVWDYIKAVLIVLGGLIIVGIALLIIVFIFGIIIKLLSPVFDWAFAWEV